MNTLLKMAAVVFLALIGLAGYGCHTVNVDDQNRRVAEQQWRLFSAEHHCKVVKENGWEGFVTWQCGDFQIRRGYGE